MLVKWRKGYRARIKAKIAYARVKELEKKHNRRLKPADVVDDARSPRSPLHKAFPWNDAEAAEQCRLQLARMMLNSFITVYVNVERPEETPTETHVYINLSEPEESRERFYRPIEDVLETPELREQALRMFLQDYQAFKVRWHRFRELSDLFETGDVVIGRIPRG